MNTPYKPTPADFQALAADLRFVQDGAPADTVAKLVPKQNRAERYAAALYVLNLLDVPHP